MKHEFYLAYNDQIHVIGIIVNGMFTPYFFDANDERKAVKTACKLKKMLETFNTTAPSAN